MKRILEIAIVTAVLIALTKFLYDLQNIPFIAKYYSTIFAVLFLYVPMMMLWLRHEQIDFIDNSFLMFGKGLLTFIVVSLIVFPAFFLCAHYWEIWVYGKAGFRAAPFGDFFKFSAFQMLLVALPEEFFFRGYFQGTLNKVLTKRWRLFGASIGWSLLITAIVFAFAHSFVHYQWWHFSIFFPALVFGWLRERTGSITASVLFHTASNVVSDWIVRSYI